MGFDGSWLDLEHNHRSLELITCIRKLSDDLSRLQAAEAKVAEPAGVGVTS